MSLARTYRGIPSSSGEIGGNTTLTRRPKKWGAIRTSGLRPSVRIAPQFLGLRVSGGIAPNLSGLRRYSPIRPRQTHGILSLLLTKLEAYSVQQGMHLWISGRV